eukprot:g34081.t1
MTLVWVLLLALAYHGASLTVHHHHRKGNALTPSGEEDTSLIEDDEKPSKDVSVEGDSDISDSSPPLPEDHADRIKILQELLEQGHTLEEIMKSKEVELEDLKREQAERQEILAERARAAKLTEAKALLKRLEEQTVQLEAAEMKVQKEITQLENAKQGNKEAAGHSDHISASQSGGKEEALTTAMLSLQNALQNEEREDQAKSGTQPASIETLSPPAQQPDLKSSGTSAEENSPEAPVEDLLAQVSALEMAVDNLNGKASIG